MQRTLIAQYKCCYLSQYATVDCPSFFESDVIWIKISCFEFFKFTLNFVNFCQIGSNFLDFFHMMANFLRSCQILHIWFNLVYSCFQIRCVLCGTVAKSRNSLHSHMSRQHRGISTKVVQIKLKSGRKTNTYLIFLLNLFQDLPVLPMPSPFDAELASK